MVRVGFIGPYLSRTPGWVSNQGEVIGGLFSRSGYEVRSASGFPQPFIRLLDTIFAILRWGRQVDILVIDVFSGLGFVHADVASFLASLLSVQCVFVLRGGNLPDFRRRHPRWVRRVLQRGAAILAPSGFMAVRFEDFPNVRQIPNVIDIQQYPFAPRQEVSPRLLWMRTFHEIYNPLLAIDVLERVMNEYPDAHLVMAGQDKGQLSAVQKQAEAKGLADRVDYPGLLNMSDKQRVFRANEIFINTNHIDNMPVSVLEAAAFGLPIVATNVGGIPYLLEDGVTGLLVPDNDAQAMAAAVIRLIENPDLARTLSVNGRKLAEKCSWDSVLTEWEKLFAQILEEAG